MKTLLKSIALAVVLSVGGMTQVQAQSIVYDNTAASADRGVNFGIGSLSQMGDEVILAGTARTITDFSFQYWGEGLPENAEVVLRFYANNGTDNAPSTLLYEAPAFGIGNTDRSVVAYHTSLGDLNGGITVPDDFTWTVAFNNLGTGHAGLTVYDQPSVGNGYNDYWANNGSSWTRMVDNGVPPLGMSFAAQITAVPEPTTMALLGLGGLAGLVWKRRQSR